MAFINEVVPEAESKEIQITEYKSKTPQYWTIDREREAILFKYWTNRDDSSKIKFAFIWKEKVFDIGFKKETFEPNIVKWTLESINITPEYQAEKEDIMDALRDAMRVYGFSGYQYYDSEPAEVIINF